MVLTNMEVFNDKSRGALRLSADGFAGDFNDESFFSNLTGAQVVTAFAEKFSNSVIEFF